MDRFKGNPYLHKRLIEALKAGKRILLSHEKPDVYEHVAKDGNRKWLIVSSDVFDPQTQKPEILDNSLPSEREAI